LTAAPTTTDKKAKSQGKTLAQMAQETNNQNIDDIFSTSTTQPQDTFNPYTSFIPNQTIAPTYVQPQNNVFLVQQQQQQQQPFNQQPNVNNQNNNNVFDIFSSNQPTYSSNQNKDPFADLGKLK